MVISKRRKKLTVIDGVCIAGSGLSHQVNDFVDWWKKGRDQNSAPSVTESTIAIIHHDGRIEEYFEHCIGRPFDELDPPMAWGSGCEYALGAMLAGADAKRAVEIACERDVTCGGDIQVVTLEDLQASWNASHPEKPIDFQPPDPRIDALLNAEAARAAHIAEGGEWKDFDPNRPLIDRQAYMNHVRLSSLHEFMERMTYRKIQEDDKSEGVKEHDVPPEGGGL